MKHTLIVRLVDITLLLLLSLMAIASIDPYAVTLPYSEVLEDTGSLHQPLQVAISAQGEIQAYDDTGNLIALSPAALAIRAAGQVVEVAVDQKAPARRLLELHRALDAHDVAAAFLVARAPSAP